MSEMLVVERPVSPSEAVDDSWEYGLRDALFTGCKVGDVDTVSRLLQPEEAAEQAESDLSAALQDPLTLLNKPIDSSGFTLLHVASAAAQKAVVRLLLDKGADPASRYEARLKGHMQQRRLG